MDSFDRIEKNVGKIGCAAVGFWLIYCLIVLGLFGFGIWVVIKLLAHFSVIVLI